MPRPPVKQSPALLVLLLAGLLLCLFLSSFAFGDAAEKACALVGSSCREITSSPYGSLFGLPVSFLGAGYFVVQLTLFLQFALLPDCRDLLRRFQQLFAGLALLASILYGYLLFFVLDGFCVGCLGVHGVNLALFLLLCRHRFPSPGEDGRACPRRQALPLLLVALLTGTIAILGLLLGQSRFLLQAEWARTRESLSYARYMYEQAPRHVFGVESTDLVIGNPEKAVHQIVLLYKEGCRHCAAAREKLSAVVRQNPSAVFLLLRDIRHMQEEEKTKRGIDKVPQVFVNGKRAEGWELDGFLVPFTEECGC